MSPHVLPPDGSAPAAPAGQTLRQKAEARWGEVRQRSPDTFGDLTIRDSHIMLHDLHVHQIELELQNEELRQAKDALSASRARYVGLYDLAPVGYCSVNAAGLVVQANLTLATLLGVAREALLQRPFSNLVVREDQDCWYQLRQQLPEGGEPQIVELRLRLDTGMVITGTGTGAPSSAQPHVWAQLATTLAQDETGQTLLHIAVSDISARKQADAKLQLAAGVFSCACEGILITDAAGFVVDVNDAFTRITGYSRAEAIGQNPRFLSSGRQDSAFYADFWRGLKELGHWSGEMWNRRKSGEVYAELLNISAVRDAQGTTQQYVALFTDITAIKAHQSQLEHIAHFDALTHLPNRVLLADRLLQGMAHATRRGDILAVAYLDLDGFKGINDRHGHDVGDQLLVALTDNMKQALREGDTLSRIGGDEFVAVLTGLTQTPDCLPLLTRLLGAAAKPVTVGDFVLQVSASLGVTFFPQAQAIEADQLVRQADQAMYLAKMAGKNRYHVFDAALDSNLRTHHEDLRHIERALERREFVLHYQPKVNMRTGQVIGAEALIRWQHPEKGLLPPAAFLPAIEDHPLAADVGEWVIDSALFQIERWRAVGLDLPVSVNIGARQIQQTNFVARLQATLAKHPQVRPALLELEILETSALADIAQVSQVIEDCTQLGIAFALDDFGTGYSSLTYLKRLRVATLKIDQSFVRDMLQDADDLAILQGVVGLATAFKRGVIAEGVETIAHGTALLQLGCELAQGYSIARPMPGGAMPAWAAAWANSSNPFE